MYLLGWVRSSKTIRLNRRVTWSRVTWPRVTWSVLTPWPRPVSLLPRPILPFVYQSWADVARDVSLSPLEQDRKPADSALAPVSLSLKKKYFYTWCFVSNKCLFILRPIRPFLSLLLPLFLFFPIFLSSRSLCVSGCVTIFFVFLWFFSKI